MANFSVEFELCTCMAILALIVNMCRLGKATESSCACDRNIYASLLKSWCHDKNVLCQRDMAHVVG